MVDRRVLVPVAGNLALVAIALAATIRSTSPRPIELQPMPRAVVVLADPPPDPRDVIEPEPPVVDRGLVLRPPSTGDAIDGWLSPFERALALAYGLFAPHAL
ncbi:MAG TPA: hypothetical protein VMJ10_09755 [Kofleriaceae bacterium]|nr:hypothetical protein [Kofleriaceae bacterium]